MTYMKFIGLVLLLVSTGYSIEAQDKELEYKSLQFLNDKEILSTREFQLEVGNWDWFDAIEPKVDFPFDFERYSFNYMDTLTFEALSKEVIYDRIMEFTAINGGRLESIIKYANVERGVVVARGNIPFIYNQDYRVFFIKAESTRRSYINATLIFRLTNDNIELQVIPHTFKDLYYGSIENSAYTYEADVTDYYPLTNVRPGVELDRKRNRINAYRLIKGMHDEVLSYIQFIRSFVASTEAEFNDYE